MSGWVRLVGRTWYLRIAVIVSMNLFLFLLISFPNPLLFLEQLCRQSHGIEAMVVVDDPRFIEFAEEAYNYSRERPESYVHERIQEMHDHEIYWNVEYWAYPHETIDKGAGDCEDLAILTKAVYRYTKEKYGRCYREEIIRQEAHVYVMRNDTIKNKTETYGWKMTDDEFREHFSPLGKIQTYFNLMPPWRWLLYLLLASLLNYNYYKKIYLKSSL